MASINLDISHLEAVLAVARAGSFRAAAEFLNLTQPSVSSRVMHAENVLGVKLFYRTTRTVTLTEHGRRLCICAESTIADLRALSSEFRDESRLKRGQVRFGATPVIASTTVPSVIRRFTLRYPGVDVVMRDDFFGRALERVTSGEVDFALIPYPKESLDFDFIPLYRDEIMLMAPLGHPLLRAKRANITAISKYPVIAMTPNSGMYLTIRELFERGGQTFKPVFETLNMVTQAAMVRAGFGVGFTTFRASQTMNMDSIRTVGLGPEGVFSNIGAVKARGRALQPAAESLIAAFKDFSGAEEA